MDVLKRRAIEGIVYTILGFLWIIWFAVSF